MFRTIRRFFTNLKKVILFIPVIWGCPNWDWVGLLIVMQHQLKQLRKCLDSGYHKGGGHHANKIRTCELLIDRLIQDNYCEYEMEQHSLKWGELKISFTPHSTNSHKAVLFRKNVITKKDEEVETNESKKIYKHEEYMKKQDINYLFDTIKKNLTSWWD